MVNTFGRGTFSESWPCSTTSHARRRSLRLENTQCLVLTRWEFLAELELDGKMATVILKELAQRFQRAMAVL